MFKHIFDAFKKKPQLPEVSNAIELSKIDKHMNFILRDRLGLLNKTISDKIVQINSLKDDTIQELRALHKKELMNPNIPQREIQIMDGNRDHYVKRISRFVTDIQVPKSYLEAYDYCIEFSRQMESLSKEIQKNVFVLGHFFENEVRTINKDLARLEDTIIEIRVMFEKNNIELLKDMQLKIKQSTKNILRVRELQHEIAEQQAIIEGHKDKIAKLEERIGTITSGSEYRSLEGFKKEKDDAEQAIRQKVAELEKEFSELETALRKYFYRNPDKKIIKAYLDDIKAALLSDHYLDIVDILAGIRQDIESNAIELKDKKHESTLHAIERLSMDYIKNMQAELRKLEDARQHAQGKITHNSASLNLSEQQYWLDSTKGTIDQHEEKIAKIRDDISRIRQDNERIKEDIRLSLEKITGEKVEIKDDLEESITSPIDEIRS